MKDSDTEIAGIPQYEARTRYFGEIAEHYHAGRRGKRRWQSEQEIVADLICTCMVQGDIVLDVPFGTGRFANLYADAGVEVRAVDVSPDMLKAGIKRLGGRPAHIRFSVGDAACLPFPDASVDHVVCVRLLGHLPPDVVRQVLAEFRRVARKTVIIHLPVRDGSPLGALRRAVSALPSAPLALARRAVRNGRRTTAKLVRWHRSRPHTGGPTLRYPPLTMQGVAALGQCGPWGIRDVVTREEGSDAVFAILTPVRFFVLGKSEPGV